MWSKVVVVAAVVVVVVAVVVVVLVVAVVGSPAPRPRSPKNEKPSALSLKSSAPNPETWRPFLPPLEPPWLTAYHGIVIYNLYKCTGPTEQKYVENSKMQDSTEVMHRIPF